MNQAVLNGYINIGKYGGERETASGKVVTTFQLSSPKTVNGRREYEYYNMTCWHDDYGTQDGIVEGRYARIECIPRAWKKDGKSGVDFTVQRIWWAPEKGAGKAPEKPSEEPYSDEDIPF